MVRKIGVFCALILFLGGYSAMALNMKPGKYEITTSMKMAGMPAGMSAAMPGITITECMTEQEPVPTNTSAQADGCKVINMKTTKDTVTFSMECKQDGTTVKSTGSMTYHGDSFEGSTQMDMGGAAGGMSMTTVVKGKRIGPCD